MNEKEIRIKVFEYENIAELPEEEQGLILKAQEASMHSYAPYSQFQVGAAVLLENGVVIKGSNQENAAYPSGLCAERVALFYANAEYPQVAVKTLVVTAYTKGDYIEIPVPPCGACRQVILETEIRFRKPIKIIMAGTKKIRVMENAHTLLPLNFDESFL